MSAVLDENDIRVVNWNIYKGKKRGWQDDLKQLSRSSDLLLIQEAVLANEMLGMLNEEFYLKYSLGYTARRHSTGVLTAAKAKPIAMHSFQVREPLLRTNKAALITEYRLNNRDETLLVINIHAINFTVGMEAFKSQLRQVFQAISFHKGPVILSGDFNTWHQQRLKVLIDMVDTLKLKTADFCPRSRKAFLGYPLDYVFYRGLAVKSSEVVQVKSSDHNPLIASMCIDTSATA